MDENSGLIRFRMHSRGSVLCWVFVTVLLLAAQTSRAHAFCLAPQLQVSDEFFVSPLVLEATVVSSHDVLNPTDEDSIDGTIYTLQSGQIFRGLSPGVLRVYSENTTARFPMERHKAYILFLTRDFAKHWVVDNCGNSGPTSTSTKTIAALRTLPLTKSYVYGDVYAWPAAPACSGMELLLDGPLRKETRVAANCAFKVTLPPGQYRAELWKLGDRVLANNLNYKDVYCFKVPVGGSAGIAFRDTTGMDDLNRRMAKQADQRDRDRCRTWESSTSPSR